MQEKIVGVLWGGDVSDVSFIRGAFLGKLKGPGITIKDQYAGGNVREFPRLAAELVKIPVDVIVASGTPAAVAARDAAKGTIPIVFAAVGNPALVLPAPKVTGVRLLEPESSGKRLENLKDAIPSLKRVAVLRNANNPVHQSYLVQMQVVANTLGITLQPLDALDTLDAEALIVLPDPDFHSGRSRIRSFAEAKKLPTMYSQSSYVEEGGLMSYGPNYPAMFQQAADLVNDILATGNIPDVEPVRSSDLVINLKTAKAIGLAIPQSVQQRAILIAD
jgi:putative ABC transport system substrate-binding protein